MNKTEVNKTDGIIQSSDSREIKSAIENNTILFSNNVDVTRTVKDELLYFKNDMLKDMKDTLTKFHNKYIKKLNDMDDRLKNTETKTKDDSNSINFVQFFLVEYFFEKQQPLIIKILNNNSIQELIETNIGNIMGCRGQKLKKVLSDNSILEISGLNLENKNMKCTFEISLNGNFNNMSIS